MVVVWPGASVTEYTSPSDSPTGALGPSRPGVWSGVMNVGTRTLGSLSLLVHRSRRLPVTVSTYRPLMSGLGRLGSVPAEALASAAVSCGVVDCVAPIVLIVP